MHKHLSRIHQEGKSMLDFLGKSATHRFVFLKWLTEDVLTVSLIPGDNKQDIGIKLSVTFGLFHKSSLYYYDVSDIVNSAVRP